MQPTIKQLKRNNDTDQGGSEIKKKSKNQNQINNESRERTVNNEMVEEWKMRSGENYDTLFKDKVKQGPILSMGCKGCHKYHNKGWCFPDCNNKESHRKLSEKDSKQFGSYCKQCRGE